MSPFRFPVLAGANVDGTVRDFTLYIALLSTLRRSFVPMIAVTLLADVRPRSFTTQCAAETSQFSSTKLAPHVWMPSCESTGRRYCQLTASKHRDGGM